MAITMDHVVKRKPNKGRFVDMTGYISPHGVEVLEYVGIEECKGRKISVWKCKCPVCGKEFHNRQNTFCKYRSCGCLQWSPTTSTEWQDLRAYHKQLMVKPERLCERWQDAKTFARDLEPHWTTGHILCRVDASRPFGPDNWSSCPAAGCTRKCRVINVGTPEQPHFLPSPILCKLFGITRSAINNLSDEKIRDRFMSLQNRQSAGAGQPHPDPHPTAAT